MNRPFALARDLYSQAQARPLPREARAPHVQTGPAAAEQRGPPPGSSKTNESGDPAGVRPRSECCRVLCASDNAQPPIQGDALLRRIDRGDHHDRCTRLLLDRLALDAALDRPGRSIARPVPHEDFALASRAAPGPQPGRDRSRPDPAASLGRIMVARSAHASHASSTIRAPAG